MAINLPGSRNVSEFELVGSVIDALPATIGLRGSCVVKREVPVARSIADIVLAGHQRVARSFDAPLSVSESLVLATLRRMGATRIDILEKRCGVAVRDLRGGLIDRLENEQLVRRYPGGRIAARPSWSARLRVVAFEAKLLRWRQALAQATLYKRYADETYVILPETISDVAVSSSNVFLSAGIGLISVGSAGLSVRIQSQRQTQHDWQREFVCSRLLSR